jgi:ABC-2 type transport system ATP-binding protein
MTGHPDLSSTQAVRAVALQRLVKSYRSPDGPMRAVRGIDVSIERGEAVALLGPNGAGKSSAPTSTTPAGRRDRWC